jgi:O-antigen/teichoic acid export membrane protein
MARVTTSDKSFWIVFKKLTLLTKNGVITAAASYTITIMLLRYLGPAEFGHYSYILIIGSIFSLLINFETDRTAPALYAKGKGKVDVVNQIYSAKFFGVVAAFVILSMYSFRDPLMSSGVFILSLASLNLSFLYEISNKNVIYSYIYLLERVAYIAIVSVLLFTDNVNLYFIFGAFFISISLSLMAQIYLNWDVIKQFRPKLHNYKTVIQENYFLLMVSLSTLTYGGFSRLIIENKFGMAQLGIYSAGWQIIIAATMFQAQVTKVWRVKLISAIHENDKSEFWQQIRSYLLMSTLPNILLSAVIIFFKNEIIDLIFGHQYTMLYELLPIFAAYFVVVNLDGLANIFWVGFASRKEYFLIGLVSTITLVSILMVLPHSYGLFGIGLSVIIVHALSVIVLHTRFYFKYLRKLIT